MPVYSNVGTGQSPFLVPLESPFADNTARDAWASANTESLYNGKTLIIVGGASYIWSGTSRPATYDNTRWTSTGGGLSADGVDARIATVFDVNDFASGDLVKFNGVKAAPAAINETTDALDFTKSGYFPGQSVGVGPNWTIEDMGASVGAKDISTNTKSMFLHTDFDETGTIHTILYEPQSAILLSSFGAGQSDDSELSTLGTTLTYRYLPPSSDTLQIELHLKAAVGATNVLFQAFENSTATGTPYSEFRADLSVGTNVIVLPAVMFKGGVEGSVKISASTAFQLRGKTITGIPGPVGVTQFMPWFDGKMQSILQRDIPGTGVNDIPALVDTGGGVAGFPAVSGYNLTNLQVSNVTGLSTILSGLSSDISGLTSDLSTLSSTVSGYSSSISALQTDVTNAKDAIHYNSICNDVSIDTGTAKIGRFYVDTSKFDMSSVTTVYNQTSGVNGTCTINIKGVSSGDTYWTGANTSSTTGYKTITLARTATAIPSSATLLLEIEAVRSGGFPILYHYSTNVGYSLK